MDVLRSIRSLEDRFWDNVRKTPNCWLWMASVNAYGYGRLQANGKKLQAHRVAYELLVGPIPSDMNVLHHCDDPACVNPSHLFLGDDQDNAIDRENKGRGFDNRGEHHPLAKLTLRQVTEIREKYATGEKSQRELAEEYRVSCSNIGYIVRGLRWRD